MAFEDAVEFMRGASAVKNGLRVVPFAACREAARRCGMSAREAEAAALRAGLCPSRYERSVGTVGLDGQARLLESCAAVAGCGGLGGWIIEILARVGVGKLILADGDTFGENNLNRQLYAAEENLGEPKAEAAARRVRAVNSAVEVKALNFFLNEENCEAALDGADVVLDALDGNGARSVVFRACAKLGVPFVHGAIGGLYGETAVLRAGDVPPWELFGAGDKGEEVECGNPPFTPPFIASAQAAEAVRILTRGEETQRKTLFWFDISRLTVRRLNLK